VTARKTNGVFACFDGEFHSLLEDIPFIRHPEPELSLSMSSLPGFLTHYFEADKGPFRNICDLPDQEIEAEKHAGTAFNRFAIGPNFFKIRRAADDLLIEKYTEKFGVKPQIRPYFAVLGIVNRRAWSVRRKMHTVDLYRTFVFVFAYQYRECFTTLLILDRLVLFHTRHSHLAR
jgi:hypothetical protein